ncbi:four helix bundle protein [Acidaminococcus fermentans]|uniref:Four helix bundle protein n=1 Tax=Acidaminococcus fermentans TaxID=905 RepID=A0A6N7VN03_ACIFE|nr:four helix bundle protein [Acidaminococcus fermentans]MSS82380.1 four helix bundle protein [Acidaminococcus fermentans]
MAVPKSQRESTPLTVLVEANALVCYTIKLCTDESKFPKRYRWCLTQEIVQSAVNMKANIARANSVYVNNHQSGVLRRTYQQKALADLAALSALMDTAFNFFDGLRHLDKEDRPQKRVNIANWTAQLIKVKSLILAWKKADAEKFKFMADC